MQIKLNNSDLILILPKDFDEIDSCAELYDEMYHVRKASDVLMFQNFAPYSYGNIVISHISPEDAMPFGDEKALIDEIHNTLTDHQGLIEVESGTNPRGFEYIYSIIKTYHQDLLNVNYCLRMNIKNGDEIIEVNASFFEVRMTNLRGSMAMNLAMSCGLERSDDSFWIKGWAEDPYDPNYDKGCLMIMSERRGLDGLFPDDPLSKARELVLALTKDSYYKTKDEIESESASSDKDKKTESEDQPAEEKSQEEKDRESKEFGEKLFGKDTVRAREYKVDIIEGTSDKKGIKLSIPKPEDIKKLARKATDGVKTVAGKASAELDKVKTPFEIPDDFRCKLNQPMPKELPGWGKREYIGFGKATFAMHGIIMSWPVTAEESLPFDTKETIRRFHEDIDENTGLILVKSGLTPKGNRYVYVIRKMRFLDEEGKQQGPTDYELNFNIRLNGRIHFLNGSFQATEEMQGIRGALDTLTYGSRELKLNAEEWEKDPYGLEREAGYMMNWKEDEKYDAMFPYHPLSELRRFAKYVVENN